MNDSKNWIIGAAVTLMLAAGGHSLYTGKDIPEGVQLLLTGVFTSVLLHGGAQRKDEDKE